MNNFENIQNLSHIRLYKLKNKNLLAQFLNISLKNLKKLKDDKNYNVYYTNTKNKKRLIQDPNPILKKIHRKIANQLTMLPVPSWLFSGVKKRSYVKNASVHKDNKYIVTADINKFYESCNIEYIFRMLRYLLKMSDDVAWLLAELLTYKKIIPTGSPASQILAFWTYYPVFKNIEILVKKHNISMSLYVDDFTFSSNTSIPNNLLFQIDNELKSYGLKLKKRKTKKYKTNSHKKITGVIITPQNKMKVPNSLGYKIIKLLPEHETYSVEILGSLRAARQIETTYMESTYIKLNKSYLHKKA